MTRVGLLKTQKDMLKFVKAWFQEWKVTVVLAVVSVSACTILFHHNFSTAFHSDIS